MVVMCFEYRLVVVDMERPCRLELLLGVAVSTQFGDLASLDRALRRMIWAAQGLPLSRGLALTIRMLEQAPPPRPEREGSFIRPGLT